MATSNPMPDTVDAALRWRCRRGMLELDLLLNGFIDQRYTSLSDAQKKVLDRLLDYPDQLLFDMLLGYMQASDPEVTKLVEEIRGAATNPG